MTTAGGVSILELVLLLITAGGLVGSSDVVPLPADPIVAQIAPAECLFYSSWTGKTHASPDAANSTEQLFTDAKFLDYLQHVDQRLHQSVLEGIASQGVGEEHVEGAFRLLDHLHSHAGSFYISAVHSSREELPEMFGGLVMRVDDDDIEPIATTLAAFLQLVPEPLRSTVKVGHRQFSLVEFGNRAPPISWGIDQNYLVVGIGAGEAEKIIERLNGSVPVWLQEAKKRVATPRPASFVHLDVRNLLDTIRSAMQPADAATFAGMLEAFGLDAVESFSYGGGLDDQGTVSRGLLKLSGDPRGMLTLMDCEPLVAADFQRISSKSPVALVFQLNLAAALTALLDSLEHEKAPQDALDTARQLRLQLEMMRHALGIDMLDDLLGSIGDTGRVFAQPGPQALTGGWTLSVDLVDAARFSKMHDQLLAAFRQQTRSGGPLRVVSGQNEQVTFHSAHMDGFPLVPTWCIYRDAWAEQTAYSSGRRTATTVGSR